MENQLDNSIGFDVTITCDADSHYEGVAAATPCAGSGPYTLSGCTLIPDEAALLAFKSGGDPAGELSSWSGFPCAAGWDSDTAGWVGVRCNSGSGDARVTRLNLADTGGNRRRATSTQCCRTPRRSPSASRAL